MSFEEYKESVGHRQGIYRLLMGLLLAICILGLAAICLLAWLASRGERPPQIIYLSRSADNHSHLTLDTFCLRSQLTFLRSSKDQCHPVSGPRIGMNCNWNFTDKNKKSLDEVLRAEVPGDSAYTMVIYGGHDSVPVNVGSQLDSNFDLASQRAVAVVAYVKHSLDELPEPARRRVAVQFAIPLSHTETLCEWTRPQRGSNQETREDVRRSPIIEITRSTISP
jgi:hypothetical protein